MNPFEHDKGDKPIIQISYAQWTQLMDQLSNITSTLTQMLLASKLSQPNSNSHAPTYYAAAAINYAQHPNDPIARMMAFSNPPGNFNTRRECCTDQLNMPVGPEASIELEALAYPPSSYLKRKYHVTYIGQLATTKFNDTEVEKNLDWLLRRFGYHTGMKMPIFYDTRHEKYYHMENEDREALSNITAKELNDAFMDESKEFIRTCGYAYPSDGVKENENEENQEQSTES